MASLKLLLVDDDETVLSALSVILEAKEFEVSTASSVVEALRLITSEGFDVLISDLQMPGAGDGLIVVGAMRHANPKAVTLVLSANPDMTKATAALCPNAHEVFLKPPNSGAIVQAIRQRLDEPGGPPRQQMIESIATVLERERSSIVQAWLTRMGATGSFASGSTGRRERAEHLPEALNEILYRLRHPHPMGLMTLFSMASLQHGARRRRQGLRSPMLVEEGRALQVVLFETIQENLDRIDLGQLPMTLMAIADEINAQLLQSLSGYENEKPVEYAQDGN